MSKVRNYLDWKPHLSSIAKTSDGLHNWLLERLPHVVCMPDDDSVDLRDVGKFIECEWSAYLSTKWDVFYFFEDEIEAVAFKLKFL